MTDTQSLDDNPKRYAILGLSVLLQALTFGILVYGFTFWVEPWTKEFDVSRGWVMAIVTGHMISLGICSAFLGPLVDKVDARMAVVGGLVAFSTGMAMVSLAANAWFIAGIYVLIMPIGAVFAGPLMAMTLVARNFTHRRGLAFGITSAGTSLGGVIFPYVITWLLVDFGWRSAHLWLASVPALLLIPFAWWALRDEGGRKSSKPVTGTPPVTLAFLVRAPAFWILSVAFMLVGLTFGSLQFNLRPYASDIGITLETTATIAAGMSLAMLIGKLGFGALMDKYDHHRLFALGCSAMIVGALLLLLDGGVLLVGTGYVLLGLGAGAFLPLKGGLFSAAFGVQAVGRSVGLAQPIVALYALGPPLFAWLREQSDGYSLGIAAAMIGAIMCIPLVLALRWTQSRTVQGASA